ncbi:MAG: molybdopterin oxidoreductase family protein [Herpetosiphonaceae bacterium]|nr:molybdopterin oxidoreductase family protein [Herpetosiphonaceae bacterium]
MTTFALDPNIKIVRGACPHDCPDTCAMLVKVKDGKAISVGGDPSHPVTQGFLCAKVSRYVERTYHPGRLLYPQRRVGARGAGQWERIGWDEALQTIATRFKGIVAEHGAQAILPYSYAGTMGLLHYGSMDRRFFNKLGASLLDRTICSAAGQAGLAYTVGDSIGTDIEQFAHAKLILIWGSNTLTSNPHLWPFIKRARAAGARVIAIDPYRSRTAAQCDEHLAINVGTDAALALGMMHVIFREGLEDRSYLEQYTVGAQELRQRVLEYPPERVAEITGLQASRIAALAQQYATEQPAVIRVNYGLQRHAGGGMAVRTIACLPAVVGAWRQPAGGILLSSSGSFPLNVAALERRDLVPAGTRTINMNQLGAALTTTDDPPVKALYVYNSNPAAVAPDLEAVQRGLLRDDLFVVVHEQFMTDTADYADILLPATTQLEHCDIHKAYGHLYLLWNEPAIAPLGEALPNTEVFRRLAAHMGFDDPYFQDSDEELARQVLSNDHPALQGITLELLKEKGWVRLQLPQEFAPFAAGRFPTPSGKCELMSQRMADDGLESLPTYTPPRESATTNPELAACYPLALLSPPAHHFLNTTFVNVLQRFEGEPTLEINAVDAQARGLIMGDMVQVWNDRGSFEVKAVITDRVKPGVIVTPSIWWRKLAGDGRNVNMTTGQALSDMGGGATFYDNLVEVAKRPRESVVE